MAACRWVRFGKGKGWWLQKHEQRVQDVKGKEGRTLSSVVAHCRAYWDQTRDLKHGKAGSSQAGPW